MSVFSMSTAAPVYVLIAAGEVSGDLLGAEIMQEMKQKRPEIQFVGIGGEKMLAQGLTPLASMDIFPGMGLVEVLSSLPRIGRALKYMATWAGQHRPALAIMIDNQEFSSRLAKKLSPLGIPCVMYPAPKVWAWRQHRVVGLQKIFQHVLCLFPFEPPFFVKHNLPATYIGHPVALRLAALTPEKSHTAAPTSRAELSLALLPGSRRAELVHHWPLFLQAFALLKKSYPHLQAVLPLPDKAALARCKAIGWADAITPVLGDDRFEAMRHCQAALTKSGTNNLELALLDVPAVVAYRMNPLTFAIVRRMVKVPFISPVNLVAHGLHANQPVFPEFIQQAATPAALATALKPLLANTAQKSQQKNQLASVRQKLAMPIPPAQKAAEILLKFIP